MRIFLTIVSLIIAAACVFLGVLGYNGTLSLVEFVAIGAAVDILLCLVMGHFMYRTYANRKRAKALSLELQNAQAALAKQKEETDTVSEKLQVVEDKLAEADETIQLLQKQKEEAASASTRAHQTVNYTFASEETENASDVTTLYQTPFSK